MCRQAFQCSRRRWPSSAAAAQTSETSNIWFPLQNHFWKNQIKLLKLRTSVDWKLEMFLFYFFLFFFLFLLLFFFLFLLLFFFLLFCFYEEEDTKEISSGHQVELPPAIFVLIGAKREKSLLLLHLLLLLLLHFFVWHWSSKSILVCNQSPPLPPTGKKKSLKHPKRIFLNFATSSSHETKNEFFKYSFSSSSSSFTNLRNVIILFLPIFLPLTSFLYRGLFCHWGGAEEEEEEEEEQQQQPPPPLAPPPPPPPLATAAAAAAPGPRRNKSIRRWLTLNLFFLCVCPSSGCGGLHWVICLKRKKTPSISYLEYKKKKRKNG